MIRKMLGRRGDEAAPIDAYLRQVAKTITDVLEIAETWWWDDWMTIRSGPCTVGLAKWDAWTYMIQLG